MKIINACVAVLTLSIVGNGLAMNNNGNPDQRKDSLAQQRALVSAQQKQQRKMEKQKQKNATTLRLEKRRTGK